MFISYRREDVGQHVLHLRRDLVPPLDEDQIFYDRESLHAGEHWKERLRDEIARCSVFMALIGKQWLKARNEVSGQRRLDEPEDWVRAEIEIALGRAAAGELIVVPLLLDGADMPKRDHVPRSIGALCDHQALALRGDTERDWKEDMAKIRGVITGQGVVAVAKAPLAIDLDAVEVEALYFANEAAQTFTVTNISNGTQKLGLKLVVLSIDVSERVRLRKAGAVLKEYTLHAALGVVGDIGLLAGEGVRIMLPPGESEAFRLALTGSEGYVYTCRLAVTCRNVETGAEAGATSPQFAVVFPVRSLDLLRARRKNAASDE